ncbi:ATP-dependent zinc metalloprotease YME1L1 isoform X2 [Hydra vulgaris]|uniref:ATP-dependent zinc metalloprotease YME1L1 isoform X2 n=1 Tax=Hydra vulgaris TaxID=6087 RepID=A0ABM4CTJ1_HYDVU
MASSVLVFGSSQVTGVINEILPSISSIKSCFCNKKTPKTCKLKENKYNGEFITSKTINIKKRESGLKVFHELGLHHLPSDWINFIQVPNLKWSPDFLLLKNSSNHWNVSHISNNTFFDNKHGLLTKISFSGILSRPYSTTSKALHNVSKRYKSTNRLSKNQILFLEYLANQQPSNANAQAEYLKAVVNEDPEYVIKRIASNNFATNEDVKAIHIKALILTDQLSPEELKRKLSNNTINNSTGVEQNPMHVVVVDDKKNTYKKYKSMYNMFMFAMTLSLMYLIFTRFIKMPSLFNSKEFLPDLSEKTVKFEDVEGCDEAKEELEEVVEFLKNPEKFQKLGAKLPGGVLLIGPPGTGKTLLARAIAGEADVPFFFASGSEFDEMFVGVGAARIRKLFASAKEHAPSIIFMDELDAIGGKRNANDSQPYSRMTLNQLLVELDGFTQNEGVIVIGATNFPEILDKALTRPGRFDSKVHVAMPDVRGRKNILQLYLKKVPCAKDIDSEVLARGSPGFSGADLNNLVNQAALRAAAQGCEEITMEHIEWAKDKIMMGPERRSAVIAEKNRNLVAYHEGGHAIVALFTPDAEPVHKATVMPRGSALGYVMQLPEKDDLSWTKKQLLAKIDVCMGGRVAEEIIFGEDAITTGASSDMQQATRIARAMVTQYGMSEKIGTVLIDEEQEKLSPELQSLIESEVKRLIQESYNRAKNILTKYAKEHKRLAEGLLKYETLNAEEINLIIKGKPIQGK